MKYTAYEITITTPSGVELDENSRSGRDPNQRLQFSWFSPQFSSRNEIEPGMRVGDIVERDICNHVLMAHTKKQRKNIVSVVFDRAEQRGLVYVEWSNGNPELIRIPTQKYTTRQIDKETGAKKRRKFHFHYKNHTIKREGECNAMLYIIENGIPREIEDDYPPIFEDDSDGWIVLSDQIHRHADAYLNTLPQKYEIYKSRFGGDYGTGYLYIIIEGEDTPNIDFPSFQFMQNNALYEFNFGEFVWFPLM